VKFKHRKHRRGAPKRSRVDKRSLRINGSNTTVTLEDAFWNALKEIAAVRNTRVSEIISTIKIERQPVRDSLVRSRLLPATSLMTPNPKHPPGEPMTLGKSWHFQLVLVTVICAPILVLGCAESDLLSPIEPGKYDFLDCPSIAKQLAATSYEEQN
jgi:hypothetical protein